MSKHLWLQKQQGEALLRLQEPADLFDGKALRALLSQAEKQGLMDSSASEAPDDSGATASTVQTNPIAQTEPAVSEAPTASVAPAFSASHSEPLVLLQNDTGAGYCLERASINAGLKRLRDMTQQQKRQHWQAARLRINEQLSDERLYLVHCIDHCLLCWRRVDADLGPLGEQHAVLRDAQGMIEHDEQELPEVTLRALETAAARALYALWLDIGSVLVAISGTGSLAIRDAWSIEQQQPLDRAILNESLNRWLESWEMDREQPFRLGADPELIFVDESNKLVSASSILLDYTSEEIGIDALLYKNKLIYPIVELRPRPAGHPARLFATLHGLLKELNELAAEQNLRWQAGAMPVKGVALGGHLHVSGIPLTPRLLRLLDVMLALPFAALADESGKARNDKFGGLGDYRKQFHGGFEYRTLPSWLVSPALTKAAIYVCWLTVEQRFALAEHLHSDDLQTVEEVYAQGEREQLCALAQKYIELLVSLTTDRRLVEGVQPLQRALQQRSTWNEQSDIRQRWKLAERSLEREGQTKA